MPAMMPFDGPEDVDVDVLSMALAPVVDPECGTADAEALWDGEVEDDGVEEVVADAVATEELGKAAVRLDLMINCGLSTWLLGVPMMSWAR